MRRDVLSCFPAGTRISSPDGGYLLWVTMPEGFPAEQYCHTLVQRGVLALPGPLFSPGGQYSSAFRLNAADYSEALLPKIQLMADTAAEFLVNQSQESLSHEALPCLNSTVANGESEAETEKVRPQ